MRPARSFREALTFGGRIPPVVGLLVSLLVAVSIAGVLLPGLAEAIVFAPRRVLGGELWRLLTWVFLETSPLNLAFAALVLWWLGRDLAAAWGERRFLAVYLGLAGASAGLTLVLALLLPLYLPSVYVGSWTVITALTVAWGLLHPDRQILLYMVLPINGRTLVWITVGGTLLYALFERAVGPFVPHLIAQGLAALYVRGVRPGRLLRRLRWNPLQALRRSRDRKRFKVIDADRDPDRDRPRWLN